MSIMTIAMYIAAAVLVISAAGVIYRIGRGPSLLDRVIAADVLLVIVLSALAVDATYRRSLDLLPLMVTIGLVGFIGSVAMARFVATRR